MTGKPKNRGQRRNRGRRNAKRSSMTGWKVAAALAILTVVALSVKNRPAGAEHPVPRAEQRPGDVVPATRYEAYPRVAETYQMVAAVPQVIDGIYCYCQCKEHSGHYSLLDCFASDHAAQCDVCLSEATLAFRMTQDGRDLEAIRTEIDDRLGD